MLTFLALAASAGFASLLAPCVLPVLPLIAGYFTSRRGPSGAAPVIEALLFAAGIVLTFTTLGVALATLVGASGVNRMAANPWLNLLVAALFVGFALSLLGLYSIRLPSRLLTRADTAAREAPRVIAPLLTGVAFSLATFACTAPFVGPLLVAASGGEWIRPVLGMFVYSTAFSLPFLLLALTPRWLGRVPRSGRWTADIRTAVAALQLGVAAAFFANAAFAFGWGAFGRDFVLTAWIVLALALAASILLRSSSVMKRATPVRFAVGAVPLMAALWLAGSRDRSFGELEAMLPPREAHDTVELPWIVNDLDEALRIAQAEQRPLFIDFTGYACGNCRWMESNMFTRERVQTALEPFVLARLFTDGEGPPFEQNQQLQEARFGTVALPLYAVLDSDGDVRGTFVGVARRMSTFVNFIESGAR